MSYDCLGKIQEVKLGSGGYQDAMFGVTFVLGSDGWGVHDFWGAWDSYSPSAKYSKADWDKSHAEAYMKLQKLMKEAKVDDLNKLKGKPIRAYFDSAMGGKLLKWEILKEVL